MPRTRSGINVELWIDHVPHHYPYPSPPQESGALLYVMANPNHINYAHEFGIHSVAAAIIFAILYIPLFGWFVRQSFARPTYVHFVLGLFCASTQIPTLMVVFDLTECSKQSESRRLGYVQRSQALILPDRPLDSLSLMRFCLVWVSSVYCTLRIPSF